MPPGSPRTTDGITDWIHDSLRQPDLQSRRVRLTSSVLQAAALAGTNYPLLPLFAQSPHQPLRQEGGPQPRLGLSSTRTLCHSEPVSPWGASAQLLPLTGDVSRLLASARLCSHPGEAGGGAADKEALMLSDKAAPHLRGSGRRRWHGQPGQAGTERSAGHGAVGGPRSPAPASEGTADGPVLLCERASRWGSYLPPAGARGEAGVAPVPADVCPACRCCQGTGRDATREPRGAWPWPSLGARGS